MDKAQEEKFDKAYKELTGFMGVNNEIKDLMVGTWQACLEANEIGEDPRMDKERGFTHGKGGPYVWKGDAPRIPDGYFKIGEEVEVNVDDAHYERCIITAKRVYDYYTTRHPENVRRIPAWEPKTDEIVFYQCNGISHVGRVLSKRIGDEDTYNIRTADEDTIIRSIASIKKFDDSSFSKPWSEI